MSYEALFQNAVGLFEIGRLDEAEQILRRILETAPSQPDVLNLLGLIAQEKGLYEQSCSLFMQAIGERPQEVSYRYNLAFSYKLSQHYYEAQEAFENVLALHPNLKEAHNEIGMIKLQLGEFEKARRSFKQALQLDANFAEAKINLAMSYKFLNTVQAIEELEKLVPSCEGEPLLWFYLSELYFERKDWPNAWAAASRTKELAPTSDEARVLLGQLSLLENQVDNAKIYFAKAELLNPNNPAAMLHLANIYSQENAFEEAEKRYRRLLELEPKNFEAHQNYAEMLYRQKRLSEALEEFRQAVIINPSSAEVSNNLALILKDLSEYEQAADLLINAYRLNPKLEEISINLSETLTLLAYKDKDMAQKVAKQWLEIDENNIFAQKLNANLEGKSFENNNLYTEKLFDHFADGYELVMQNLGYSAALAFRRIIGDAQASIVDLGCGTGLVGEALKGSAHYLIGVDISQKMLDVAAQKKVYDKLIKDDILHYLETHQDFDWAVFGDVCGYLDNIEAIIRLCQGKKILLSIEATNAPQKEVLPSGRNAYNPQYIEALLRQNGFTVVYKEDILLRMENEHEVRGVIFKGE